MPDGDLSGGTGLAEGIGAILSDLADRAGDVVRERTRGAAAILLIAVLCGALEGVCRGHRGKECPPILPMAGALSVTLASAGSLDTLLGLGRETIGELSDFSTVLLPTLAALPQQRAGPSLPLRYSRCPPCSSWTCCCG